MDTIAASILRFIHKTNTFCNKVVNTIDSFERPIFPDKLASIKEILHAFTEEAEQVDLSVILSKEELEIIESNNEVKWYASKLFRTIMWIANLQQLERSLEVIREYYSNLTSLAFNFLKKIHPNILTGKLTDYITGPIPESIPIIKSPDLPKFKPFRKDHELIKLLQRIQDKCCDMLKIIDKIKEPNLQGYWTVITDLIKIEKSSSSQDVAQHISETEYRFFEKQLSSFSTAYGSDTFPDPQFPVEYWGLTECRRSIENAKTYYQIFPMFLFTFLKQHHPNIMTGIFTDYC